MIRRLKLQDVGPARELKFDFAPRLNVLTGDNGLGKTFVLDVLWWVLTTTWAGEKAFPFRPVPRDFVEEALNELQDVAEQELAPRIVALLAKREGTPGGGQEVVTGGDWKWESQEWQRTPWESGRQTPGSKAPPEPHDEAEVRPRSLVIYARIDGSYAVFDTLYAKGGISTFGDAATVLSASELWDGKEAEDNEVRGRKRRVINGLIADWVSWQQRSRSPEFEALRRVLHALSAPDEPLVPGTEPTRVHLRDRRDIPTLSTNHGVVPVTLASAGMKRALGLAYLLVWAWTEHKKAAEQSRQALTQDLVLLIDEPELHQHPSWQRVFMPAVLRAIGMIAPNVAVQVFSATHSPMVLASLETVFSEALDGLFVLERDGTVIRANELPFVKEGDVSNWLSSEVFKRVGGRSLESSLAISAAMDFMEHRNASAEEKLRELHSLMHERGPDLPDGRYVDEDFETVMEILDVRIQGRPLIERIHDALKLTLPGHDEFWVQWSLVHRPGRRGAGGSNATR